VYSEVEILLGPLNDYTKKDEFVSSREQSAYLKLIKEVKAIYKTKMIDGVDFKEKLASCL